MKLIIVRHGQTDHNATGTHMGQLDVPLNSHGVEQAELVAARLAHEKIDAVYSSDLQRAYVTAQQIAQFHPGLTVITDPLLRERNVGVLTGQPIQPEDSIRKSRSGGINRSKRPQNGESIDDVKARATDWLQKTLTQHADDTVLVASHGLFLYILLEVAVEQGADVDREDFILANTSVTVLDVHPEGRATIVHLNDTQHLAGITGGTKEA